MDLTKLERLQDKIIENGILLLETSKKTIKALTLNINDNYIIYINSHSFLSNHEEHSALLHEYFHCKTNTFYTFNDSLQTRKRREFKAKYAMAQDILPPDKLIHLLENGYQNWEIAEEFYIDEKSVEEIYRIYKSKGMIAV